MGIRAAFRTFFHSCSGIPGVANSIIYYYAKVTLKSQGGGGGDAPPPPMQPRPGYKFGIVRYCHTMSYNYASDENLAVERHTARSPNLTPCQIFRLYGRIK